MMQLSTITTIDDYINKQPTQNNIQLTREQAIIQLINVFEQYDSGIPIFEEIYYQKGYQQGRYHKRDVLGHTKQTLIAYERNKRNFCDIISGLSQYLQNSRDNLTIDTLIKLILIYHDAGKKIMKETTGYMRGHAAYTVQHQRPTISTKYGLTLLEYEMTKVLIEHHDTPPQELQQVVIEALQTLGVYPAFLLISLSDLMATQGPAIDPLRVEQRHILVQQELQKHFS